MSCSRSHCAPNRVATRFGARIGEHAPHLAHRGRAGVRSAAAGRGLDELRVGHGAPEEERQPRREIEVGDAIGLAGAQRRRRLLEAEHEARIGEHRLQRQPDAAFEIACLRPLL